MSRDVPAMKLADCFQLPQCKHYFSVGFCSKLSSIFREQYLWSRSSSLLMQISRMRDACRGLDVMSRCHKKLMFHHFLSTAFPSRNPGEMWFKSWMMLTLTDFALFKSKTWKVLLLWKILIIILLSCHALAPRSLAATFISVSNQLKNTFFQVRKSRILIDCKLSQWVIYNWRVCFF